MKNYVSKMVRYIQKIELFEKKLSLSSRTKIFVLFFFDVQMNKQDSKFAGSKVKLFQKNVRLLFNLIQVIFWNIRVQIEKLTTLLENNKWILDPQMVFFTTKTKKKFEFKNPIFFKKTFMFNEWRCNYEQTCSPRIQIKPRNWFGVEDEKLCFQNGAVYTENWIVREKIEFKF